MPLAKRLTWCKSMRGLKEKRKRKEGRYKQYTSLFIKIDGNKRANRKRRSYFVKIQDTRCKMPVKSVSGTIIIPLLSARVPQALLQVQPSSPSPVVSLRANRAWTPRHQTSYPLLRNTFMSSSMLLVCHIFR